MEQTLIKRIKAEQNFAAQAYTNFKEFKFGIEPCCYNDFENATLNKYLCDWQNSASNKIIIDSTVTGIFIEPLMTINHSASMSCPDVPSNVCTIIDLEQLLCNNGTYIYTQEALVGNIRHAYMHLVVEVGALETHMLGQIVVARHIDY